MEVQAGVVVVVEEEEEVVMEAVEVDSPSRCTAAKLLPLEAQMTVQ